MMSPEGRSFSLLVDLPHDSAVAGASRHPSQPGPLASMLAALLGGLKRWFV